MSLSKAELERQGAWLTEGMRRNIKVHQQEQRGERFESGESLLTTSGVTIDPKVIAEREEAKGLATTGLRGLQKAREDVIGDPSTFVERKTTGLRESLGRAEEQLGSRLEKTGVAGEFAAQSKETLATTAKNKIATGELMALDELNALEGNFDLMEGGAAELLNNIDINQFSQEMLARGLSQELTSKLQRLAQGQDALGQAASQRKKQQIGQAISVVASIFSSRTFKYDMESLDNQQILDSMMELDVEKWKYNNEDKGHIGCYAEDFNERFGIKGEKTIDVVDIIGVLMASIQAQQEQIEELKRNK